MKLSFKNKLILAPMASFTSLPFRLLCKSYGADILYTELISVNAIVRGNKKTFETLLDSKTKEKPIALQLFGSNPKIFGQAVEIIEQKYPKRFDFYDINCGCPVKKVAKQKAGAELMNYPKTIEKIINEMQNNTKKSVTAKIRIFKDEEKTLNLAKQIESFGVEALAVHGRTKAQMYSGKANWNLIKQIKENLSAPVIGNGDIWSKEDYQKMKTQTKVDSAMIGRGSLGRPFIFAEIKGKEFDPAKERKKAFKKLTNLYKKEFEQMPNELKLHASYFVKEMKNATKIRNEIFKSKTYEDLENIFKTF